MILIALSSYDQHTQSYKYLVFTTWFGDNNTILYT